MCPPISHISVTRPSYELIDGQTLAKRKYDVCIILGSELFATSPFSMVTPYQQQTLFPLADQTSISLMLQWFIPDEMMCHQYQTTMASRDMQSHIGDTRINSYFSLTFLVWVKKTWDWYVLIGVGYSPFCIWHNNSVSDHRIYGCNEA